MSAVRDKALRLFPRGAPDIDFPSVERSIAACRGRPRRTLFPGVGSARILDERDMSRRRRIYEGKAKILFEGPEPGTIVQYFKDDATAFNNQKRGTITGKGVLNNRISEYIMTKLGEIGVPTHFVRRLNMREQLIKQVEIIPLEVVVRNVVAGSLAQRLGLEEGTALPRSIIEFYYKNDKLGDPMVSEEHITAFGWASTQDLDDIMALALRINDFMVGLFLGVGIRLIDFKIEFGRLYDDQDMMRIVLADEISPDSCRLWDLKTNEKMDKDRFRRDLGGVEEAYQEVARRLGILPEANVQDIKGGTSMH
jgi:phosphoribosylaminoimidazole-succinocarboxamide synthase